MLCAFFSLGAQPASAMENTLRVLAWPGYADADVIRAFELRYHARVEVTFVDSDEALWDKMHDGHARLFDVVAANTVEVRRYIKEGLLQPLQLDSLPNTRKQLPRFRQQYSGGDLTQNGNVYAIPFTYSSMGLIYDRKQVAIAPRSMSELWNPRYQGRVLDFNSAQHNFTFTALALGMHDPFQLDAKQLHRVALQLIALRRNLLGYYNLPEEATDLFMRHKVALMFGNYGTQQLTQLRKAGADVGYVIPDEGALAWLDCWAMTRAARNPPLALAWINYMLEPAVSDLLPARQGLANTLVAPAELAPRARIVWLRPVESVRQREALWSKIVSGDRPGSL